MTWQEALEKVSAQRNSPRLVELCGDSNPDREYWRGRVIEMASGVEPGPRMASVRSATTVARRSGGCCGGDSIMAMDPNEPPVEWP